MSYMKDRSRKDTELFLLQMFQNNDNLHKYLLRNEHLKNMLYKDLQAKELLQMHL